jgi:hypothetical protein
MTFAKLLLVYVFFLQCFSINVSAQPSQTKKKDPLLTTVENLSEKLMPQVIAWLPEMQGGSVNAKRNA